MEAIWILFARFTQDATRVMDKLIAEPRERLVATSLFALIAYGRLYLTVREGLRRRGLYEEIEKIEGEILEDLLSDRSAGEYTTDAEIVNMIQRGDLFEMEGGDA